MSANDRSKSKGRGPSNSGTKISKMRGLARARRLLETKGIADRAERYREQRAILEEEIGKQILDFDDTCRANTHREYAGLSPLEATQLFAIELHKGLKLFAENIDAACPPPHRYDPYYATSRVAPAVWVARQTADTAGVPYGFYVAQGSLYLYEQKRGRLPVPSQFCDPAVAARVQDLWSDASARRVWERSAERGAFDEELATLFKAIRNDSEAKDQEADPNA